MIARLLRRLVPGRRRPAPCELEPVEGYRRWAATYGREVNELQRLEQRAMAGVLPSLSGLEVLDLGCGRGRVGRVALSSGAARAFGADLTLAMLASQAGDRQSRLPSVVAAAQQLPFPSASFDTVLCSLMIGHLPTPATAFAEVARVLRPGGGFLLSDFHPAAAHHGWRRTFLDPTTGREAAVRHHPHEIPDLAGALQLHGLRVEQIAEEGWRKVPVVWALRARRMDGSP